MPESRSQFHIDDKAVAEMTDEQLAEWISRDRSNEDFRRLVELEFRYRDRRDQSAIAFETRKASEAQAKAADASIRTAQATEKYVKLMVWSVVLLAFGVAVQAIVALSG